VPAQIRCREETAKMPMAMMQIAPEQGAFLQVLVKLTGAKKYVEIGTFTGYSALSVALALPADGVIDACDVSEEFTTKARGYWAEADVAGKIRLHLAPATETLEGFVKQGRAGTYDFAFIDADKPSYPAYYELCLTLLRPGGLIAIDNALWSGEVAKANPPDESAKILRALNTTITTDARVDASMLTVGDGVLLALKK